MATPRHLSRRIGTGALLACAIAAVPAVGTGSAAGASTPARHVICAKTKTWIPADYSGGCYLTFSRAVKRLVYGTWGLTAAGDDQWAGPRAADAIASMKCTRGGHAGLVALNRWQMGTCTWSDEIFQHVGLGDHPNHTWTCEVTMVVRTGMNGKSKRTGMRMWMQWDVSAAVLDDATRIEGEFPACDKSAPDDNWLQ